MTIFGIHTLLSKDYHCWEAFRLQNSLLIIDAIDFCGHLVSRIPLGSAYGGENLKLFVELQLVCSHFRKCSIDPIFVYRGYDDKLGRSFETRLKKDSRRLDSLVTAFDPLSIQQFPYCISMYGRSILLDIVNEYGFKKVNVKHSSVHACVTLSALLNCPVVASTSDYFVCVLDKPSIASRHTYLPLSHISFDFDKQLMSSSPCVVAHGFNRDNSILSKLSPLHLPLFAVLLGSDVVPNCRLPPHLLTKIQSYDKSVHPKERRWLVLLDWFAKFDSKSTEPLRQIIQCYPPYQHTSVLQELFDGINSLTCSINDVFVILDQLNINRPLNEDILRLTAHLNSFSVNNTKRAGDPNQLEHQNIVQLMHGHLNKQTGPMDFTANWPPRFLGAFEKCCLDTKVLAAIYSSKGVILPFAVEDPSILNSVHEYSLPIRLLHYRVLVGLENQLGMQSKLVGLNPDLIEYVRRDKKFVAYHIPIEPLLVNFETTTVDSLLSKYLGFSINQKVHPDWFFSLAVSLNLWFQQELQRVKITFNLDESPIILAIVAVAVANLSNVDQVGRDLCDHYDALITSLESDIKHVDDTNNLSYQRNFVHNFNGIRLAYSNLRSLVVSLNHLCFRESDLFKFAPSWIPFPSGRLVYSLATFLARQELLSRRRLLTRMWLPRLLYVKQRDAATARKLLDMIQTFELCLNICSSCKLSALPVSFSSLYYVQDIDILKSNNPTNRKSYPTCSQLSTYSESSWGFENNQIIRTSDKRPQQGNFKQSSNTRLSARLSLPYLNQKFPSGYFPRKYNPSERHTSYQGRGTSYSTLLQQRTQHQLTPKT